MQPWFGAEARRLDAPAPRRPGGAVRRGAGTRRAPRGRRRASRGAGREPLPRAAVGAADAGPVSQRPPGGRAGCLPRGAARPLRRAWDSSPARSFAALQEAILAQDPAIAAVPVVPARRGNLPSPSTSFVGREAELAQVAGLLAEHRIVTLTRAAGRREDPDRPGGRPAASSTTFLTASGSSTSRARSSAARRHASAGARRRRTWRRPARSCGRAPARRRGDPPVRFVRAPARRGAARGRGGAPPAVRACACWQRAARCST